MINPPWGVAPRAKSVNLPNPCLPSHKHKDGVIIGEEKPKETKKIKNIAQNTNEEHIGKIETMLTK